MSSSVVVSVLRFLLRLVFLLSLLSLTVCSTSSRESISSSFQQQQEEEEEDHQSNRLNHQHQQQQQLLRRGNRHLGINNNNNDNNPVVASSIVSSLSTTPTSSSIIVDDDSSSSRNNDDGTIIRDLAARDRMKTADHRQRRQPTRTRNDNGAGSDGGKIRYTSSSSCLPATVLDSIPFVYTKDIFLSYKLIVEENNNNNKHKKFLDYRSNTATSNKLRTILEESVVETYNDLVTDCPIFRDLLISTSIGKLSSSSSFPTRELVESYFLFGYDHNNNNNKQHTFVDSSFILLSLDLKCSYCQQRLLLPELEQQQREHQVLLNSKNDESCTISLFQQNQAQSSSSFFQRSSFSCSCNQPTEEEFLLRLSDRINRDDSFSSLFGSNGGVRIVFDQISEIQITPAAAIIIKEEKEKDRRPQQQQRDKSSASVAATNNNNLDKYLDIDVPETTISYNSVMKKLLPMEITPIEYLGCLPKTSNVVDGDIIYYCDPLIISNGEPYCGAGST